MFKLLCLLIGLAFSMTLSRAATDTSAPVVQKVFLPPRLDFGNTGISPVQPIDDAAWIWYPDDSQKPKVKRAEFFSSGWREPVLLRFRKVFEATDQTLRIHVSADERFELFLDGQRIARGPDRSDVEHWCYSTYDLRLAPGTHRLEALAWSIGPYAPVAQLTWRGGFILKAEEGYDPLLTTGKAAWEVAKLDGYEFPSPTLFVGAQFTAQAAGRSGKRASMCRQKWCVEPSSHSLLAKAPPAGSCFPPGCPINWTVKSMWDRQWRWGRDPWGRMILCGPNWPGIPIYQSGRQ